jgi:hypothetical protein
VNASQKIAGFILGVVVVFAAALGVGASIGPDGRHGGVVSTAEFAVALTEGNVR